jgi:O-antigen ligase
VKAVGPEVHQGQTLRLAAWEIIIWSVLFFYIVSPFHPYLWSIFPGMHEGFRAATVEFFGTELYFLNYTMLAALVLSLLAVAFRAWQARAVSGVPVMAILFATLFASLYLLDFFLSRAPVYPYAKLSIVLLPLVIWLFVLLFADQQSALRLLKVTALFIVIQSIYGITYYVTGAEQFYTPRFGARTGGTLESPNSLYPVALMGVPLLWCLARGASSYWEARLWYAGLGTAFVALILTYTRTGWLAVVPILLWLAFHPRSGTSTTAAKRIVVLVSIALLIATVFVRTRGNYLGNPDDRSFYGRFAIWKVALKVCALHPWLGNGLDTYPWLQWRMMTSELRSFDPGNEEAKNLFLTLFAELGALGLVLFLAAIFSYLALTRSRPAQMECDTFRFAAVGCYMAVVSVLLAGLGDTPILHFRRLAPSLVFAVAVAAGTVIAMGSISMLAPDARSKQRVSAVRIASRALTFAVMLTLLSILLTPLVAGYLWFLQHRTGISTYRTLAPPRPLFTPLTEIAEPMRDALIASEDGYFYQHHGVDWQALHRALRVNIRNLAFKQGGSTITMQTARYLFLGREKTLSRKVAEILLALEMEKHLSKERILELYLNSARFGLGAEDIGTACRVYFGKSPKELTLGEAAFLAGVLPEPPRTRSELTLEKVYRCQRRALSRLAYFFPMKYSSQQIAQAMQERLVFVWER